MRIKIRIFKPKCMKIKTTIFKICKPSGKFFHDFDEKKFCKPHQCDDPRTGYETLGGKLKPLTPEKYEQHGIVGFYYRLFR